MPQPASVFIIDDDTAVLDSIAALVDAMGLMPRCFASAEELLHGIDGFEAGCIVSDVRMRGISGLELQAELRDRGSRIPVILVTAYADVPLVVQAMKSGAVTVVSKPFGSRELRDAILSALEIDEREGPKCRERKEMLSRARNLSEEESYVLSLIFRGKQTKEIADELDVSTRTIDIRRKAALHKLQASSLLALTRQFASLGIDIADLSSRH